MKRTADAMLVALLAVMLVLAAADTAAGRHGGRGYYSGGGISIVTVWPGMYGPGSFGYYPPRAFYGVGPGPRHFRRPYWGDPSFFFGFDSFYSYGAPHRAPYRSGYYGYYPRPRYRGYGADYRSYPFRSKRAWVPGRTIGGRYRTGFWEYRDSYERPLDRHGAHRDGRGRGRGGAPY